MFESMGFFRKSFVFCLHATKVAQVEMGLGFVMFESVLDGFIRSLIS